MRGGRTHRGHLLPGCRDEELLPPAGPGLLRERDRGEDAVCQRDWRKVVVSMFGSVSYLSDHTGPHREGLYGRGLSYHGNGITRWLVEVTFKKTKHPLDTHLRNLRIQTMETSTHLAWRGDKEEGRVETSRCTQTDHSQALELSQDATLTERTGL